MIKQHIILLCVLPSLILGLVSYSINGRAQTPKNELFIGAQVTISLSDVKNAMTPSERQKFEELERDFKDLQDASRGETRRAVLNANRAGLRQLAEQRDNDFALYRGLTNQSMMVYGSPKPSVAEVLAIVVSARRSGGDGQLYPHWDRTLNGPVVGLDTPPGSDEGGIPAGPERGGRIIFSDTDQTIIPDEGQISDVSKCGPRPNRVSAQQICRCHQGVFGAGAHCFWSDN